MNGARRWPARVRVPSLTLRLLAWLGAPRARRGLRRLGDSPRRNYLGGSGLGGAKLWLALAGVVTALGLAACGGDDGDAGGETTGAAEAGTAGEGEDGDAGGQTTGAEEAGTPAKKGAEPIVIKTHVAPLNARGETTGEV